MGVYGVFLHERERVTTKRGGIWGIGYVMGEGENVLKRKWKLYKKGGRDLIIWMQWVVLNSREREKGVLEREKEKGFSLLDVWFAWVS